MSMLIFLVNILIYILEDIRVDKTLLSYTIIIEVYNCFRKKTTTHLFHSKINKFNDGRMCLRLTRFECTLFDLSLKYVITSVAYILEFGIYFF